MSPRNPSLRTLPIRTPTLLTSVPPCPRICNHSACSSPVYIFHLASEIVRRPISLHKMLPSAAFVAPLHAPPTSIRSTARPSVSVSPCYKASSVNSRTKAPASTSSSTAVRTPRRFTIPFLSPLLDITFASEKRPSVSEKLGPIYLSRDILNRHALVVSDLNAIAQIVRDGETFVTAGGYPRSFQDMLGPDSLLFLGGERHAKERSKVLTAFLPGAMTLYFEEMQRSSRAFWEQLSEAVRENGNCKLDDMVRDHLLGVTIRLTGGTLAAGKENELRKLFARVLRGFTAANGTQAYRRGVESRDKLLKALCELIEERKAEAAGLIEQIRDDDKARKRMILTREIDLMTLLCALQENEKEEEIAVLVLLLWLAGYTTQSSVISCAVAKLTDEVRTRLVKEQEEARKLYGGKVSLHAVKHGCMPVLEAYLNEVMRLTSPVSAIFRRAVKETTVQGHRVEEGKPVVCDLWNALRSERHFKDPLKLDLDRYLRNDGNAKFHDWAFGVPGSPHFCLGQGMAKLQMICLMSEMFSNWEVELAPRQDLTVTLYPDVKPSDGCMIGKCERRTRGL